MSVRSHSTKRRRGVVLATSALLVVAILVLAASCGGSSSSSSSSSSTGGTTAAAADIVIGADASMSGPLAGFGAYEKWAFDTVIADMNAKGGVTVDGVQHKVTGVLLDDKSDPNVAASNIDTLVTKNKAVALLGPVTPTVGNAASLAAERQGVPYLETGNPLEPFRAVKAQWKWAFDFFFAAPDLSAGAFQWPKDLGIEAKTNKKYVVSVDNSPDGPVFIKAIEEAGKAAGWTLAMSETHPSNNTQFSSLIEKLKGSGADYIIMLGDTPEHIALRKQMDAAGYKPKILYLVRGAQLQQFADAIGALANGVVIESYWLPEMPYTGAAALGERFLKESGQSMGQILGLEYTATQIILESITKANSTDPQKVADAIASTDGTYVGGPVKFAADHTSVTPLFFTQWQNGKSVIIWPKDVANGQLIFPLP
jgi:branched-chain amino acid transport system substrate-binding protein